MFILNYLNKIIVFFRNDCSLLFYNRLNIKRLHGDNMDLKLKPREKITMYGSSQLSTKELLALILGKGSKEKNVFNLAEELAEYISVQPRVPKLNDLLKIKGLGPVKAAQILACLELSGRFLFSGVRQEINSPEQALQSLSFLKNALQENFVAISLNSANNIIEIHTLTIGLANQTQVHPREAFMKAIENRAVAVIFAHNHPSGNLSPSADDLNITKVLCRAGQLLSIPVLDHLIVSCSGFLSLKREYPSLFD